MVSLTTYICSCASLTEATVEPAVKTTLEELTEPENEERLNQLLDLHGVEWASERMGRGLMRGMITSMMLAVSDAGLMDDSNEDVEKFFTSMADQIEGELAPAMATMAADITEAVLIALASPERRRQAAIFAAEVTEAIFDTIVSTLRGDMGPALQIMFIDYIGPSLELIIEENIGPALVEILDDEFNAATGETARVIAHELTIGTTQGLRFIDESHPDEASPVEELATQAVNISESLGWVFWALIIVFGILAIALATWAVRLVFEARDIKRHGELPA